MTDYYRQAWDELTGPGGAFETTTIDVRGVPTKVFASAPPNMRVLWEMAAAHADKDYIVYEDERYTYTEISAQVRALAHLLRETHGVREGDRVAVAMRNYPEWVISFAAATSIGGIAVAVNAWWTADELRYELDNRPDWVPIPVAGILRLLEEVPA